MRYLIAVACTLLLLPLQLQARPWHVYPGGSIQSAIDNAASGDVVVVHSEIFRGFTYHESITLKSGVTVRSVAEEDDVTIDGGSDNYTVYFSGNGGGMHFGRLEEGFIIAGGARHGMYFDGIYSMHIADIEVISNPPVWDPYQPDGAVFFYNSGYQLGVRDLEIHGQTECKGLYLEHCNITFNNIAVHDVIGTGIYLINDSSYFSHPTVEHCNKGFEPWHSDMFIDGGDIRNCEYGIWASEDPLYYWDHYTFMEVDFVECTTGVRIWPEPPFTMEVYLISCTFRYCTDGAHLTRTNGHVKGCTFRDIYDTAITADIHGGTLVLGGPSGQERNYFDRVDGAGVQVVNGASPTIEGKFTNVYGTGVLCQSGSTPTIRDSRFFGSGGCFQAIRTSGTNTMAAVRNDTIQDYDSAIIPLPRGVSVTDLFMTGPTANLGTLTDRGYNQFYDNTTDLLYGPMMGYPGQTPVSMYAQYNFWGEDPPASQSFGGPWADYIIYDPWLHPSPEPTPPLVDDPGIPADLVLEAVRPNPVRGNAVVAYGLPSEAEAELCIWDIQGRLVRTLVAGKQPAGRRTVEWNTLDNSGNSTPSGVYFCRLSSSEGAITRRLVLTR